MTMAMTTMSIRVDEQDKRLFDSFCNQTGMNASVAVNMFVKKVLQERRTPFALEIDPFYSEENMAKLARSIANAKAGKLTYHEIVEAGDEESMD
jgi:DNA-damage-inducible protein J